jgi:tetratricopeptide (TPR) repeat protein/CHAT domain-containing protein
MGTVGRVGALLFVVVGFSCSAWAQGVAEADALNRQAVALYQQGKYTEAIELAKRSLAIRERELGPGHPDIGTSLNNLAELYRAQDNLSEAEPLLLRALTIDEKALGPDHPDLATSLHNLAQLYRAQGRYPEAEPLYQRSLSIDKKVLGPDHPVVAKSLGELADLYREQGRYSEAEPLYRDSLAILEKTLGSDHPAVSTALSNMALLYRAQGRYAETESLYRRSLAITEKAFGPDDPRTATLLNNVAVLYRALGRYAEAEPLYWRSLAIRESALGPDHPEVGTSLNNLAELYRAEERYAEAEPLYRRTLLVWEKALGPDHPNVAVPLNNLGLQYRDQGRLAEAELLLRRSLAIWEKTLGSDHSRVAQALGNLAVLYRVQSRHADAEPLFRRSIAILEQALGPEHPDVGISLANLAGLYQDQGRYDEAKVLFQRNLAIAERALGPDHPQIAASLNQMAELYFDQRDWAQAADFWRRSTRLVVRRAQRGTDDVGQALTGKRKGETEQRIWHFEGLVKAVHRLAALDRTTQPALAAETFQTAQWGQLSEAARSLAQMAARGAKGDAMLAPFVRERQDLVGEWQGRDRARSAAVAQNSDKRDRATETANVARLAAVDARIGEIDRTLRETFPDYAAFARPVPLSVDDVQGELRPDEALVLFLDTSEWKPTPAETFIWVVTKTDVRWVRSEAGTAALKREVAALRCGLDGDGAWDAPDTPCPSLFEGIYSDQDRKKGKPLPFDAMRAHALYRGLFFEVEDLIDSKHLIVVPSGALAQLPFQVLITRLPGKNPQTYGDYRGIAWLSRSHPITVLPAVSSLKALRRNAQSSQATKPFLGVGNPLLDGPDQRYAKLRQAALARTKCGDLAPIQVAAVNSPRGVIPIAVPGGTADVGQLKLAAPLPETADELCDVARMLGATESDILLGARSIEPEIVRMSEAGRLRDYRVLHFATHGALAGEARGSTEPGLLLTPPAQGSEADDGYLSASEIARLKLDADWVILSACNTAAGEAKDAEALSGLARAFFYAGARALLVSHWYVDSKATVALIKGAFGELDATPNIGRTEALRRSMLALIDKGPERFAHPAAWAPFVLVGEGGAGR